MRHWCLSNLSAAIFLGGVVLWILGGWLEQHRLVQIGVGSVFVSIFLQLTPTKEH